MRPGTPELTLLALAGALAAGAALAVAQLPDSPTPSIVASADLQRAASVPRAPLPEAPPAIPDAAWVTLPSGTAIADLTVGTGPIAADNMVAACDFTLWTAAGQLVDSSQGRPSPHPVHLGHRQVIRGWEDALRGMQAGGRRVARIPSALGYGPGGTAGVPGDTDLLLDLRLVSLGPPRTPPPLPAGFTLSRLGDLGGDVQGLDLERGAGEPFPPGTVVLLDYTLWTANGAQVSTTWTRSAPGRFTLGSPGLTPELARVVAGMRAGGRRLARIDVTAMAVDVPGDQPVIADLSLSVP